MQRKSLKKLAAVVCAALFAPALLSVNTAALTTEEATDSFTYWYGVTEDEKAVSIKPLYEVKTVLDSVSLGTEEFGQITDVCTDGAGNIYILDGKDSRLLVVNSDYELIREITAVEIDGYEEDFKDAQGVYVHEDGSIYICDTENERVLVLRADGSFVKQLLLPESPLIPDTYQFLPIRLAIDSKGYVYILCENSYLGAILLDPNGGFVGFFGANTVKTGLVDSISAILERVFSNDAKKGASIRELPYTFADICIDAENFVYTATGAVSELTQEGQIRKLNPSGTSNILDSESVNFGIEGTDEGYFYDTGFTLTQDFVSLAVDAQGFIYGLETSYGRIFVYDQECRLLGAFGGGMRVGDQKGTFQTPEALSLNGSDILIADGGKNTVTVFQETDYGHRVKQLRALTLSGDYAESEQGWREILAEDKNNQMAYSGVARAQLAAGNTEEALSFARLGYDRQTYALAYADVRNGFIQQNFWWIFLLAVAVLGGILALFIVTMKRQVVLVKGRQLQLMFSSFTHPFRTFTEIKEKHEGSYGLCLLLLVVYYVTTIAKELYGGFLYFYGDAESINSLWVLVRSIGLVVLWIAVNWLVCTLMNGKGNLKEISVVTCYSLLPLILSNVLYLLLSYVLLPEESAFLTILEGVMILLAFIILAAGTTIIHDYGFGKFLATGLLTIFGIAVIVLLVIMVGLLFQQLAGFVATLLMELLI